MKRPPGLWILLSAGILWLSLKNVYSIRATALIFAKSTTTTTTTTEQQLAASEDELVTTEVPSETNDTKPILTGNPQVDYIWDPNLPKELNGYNLSDYPFYERVPEEIDFKCDGLHDGFYASVPHKCQVYHHCLFGTRYDFLCANYTAFDQKTFICHFASEVDCANSKKFWHRNDALYKATPTTTVKPLINHNIYTPPPSSLISQASSGTSSAVPQDPVPEKPPVTALRRPIGGRRRPFRRRRPQYDYYEDYYDDYYEERPRSNRGRQRPRPRPRPLYDDDYDDDYEEDRYEKRGAGRRNEHRRPYGRRGSAKRRNKDDYDDEEDDRYDDFKSSSKRKLNDRPIPDVESEERYPDNRKKNRRRPLNERNENDNKSRGNQRRPNGDYEEETFQANDSSYERPKKNEQRRSRPKEETKTIVKPVSGTIYDRPRVAPRIKPPVPKNQANKYSYKNIASTRAPVEEDEEYYDDYEDEVLPKGKANVRTPVEDTRSSKSKSKQDSRNEELIAQAQPRKPDSSSDNFERVKPKITTLTKNPDDEEYYDEYEEYEDELAGKKDVVPISSTTTTTSTEMPIENIKQPLVRLVKRPFLPSRGGNPFASRGLQPVGAKALEKIQNEEVKEVDEVPSTVKEAIKEAPQQVIPEMESDEFKPAFKPSPIIIKLPMNPKLTSISSDTFRSQSSTVNAADPKTTEKPKLLSNKNPLDVIEEDYDVTFNDALNPTLPNVPVREPPTEFSSNSDYVAANNFQRPKYVLEPVVSQTGVDYVYQNPLQSAARGRPVYHHCLFGVRYDFLCANFTAFDQTLFNCNFASNVDCENSKKFWHRNDELYIEKSTTTTTAAPINYNFYTLPPQNAPLTPSPVLQGQLPVPQGQLPQPPPSDPLIPRRQSAPRVRPYARPRPQYDYYEDEYEELPRPKGRKRRPRPRPVYYEDYEDYEEERLPRRGGGRRRPYRRDRPTRRNKDRRKPEYDDEYEYDEAVIGISPKKHRRRKLDDYEYEDDRTEILDTRRPANRRSDKPPKRPDKRLIEDDYEDEDDPKYTRRSLKDDRRRPTTVKNEETKKIPRLGKRRPPSEDFEDDLQRADNSRSNERRRKGNNGSAFTKSPEDRRAIIKPASGTLYDRPRLAPKINLPIPKNAAQKYAYKGKTTQAPAIVEDDLEEYIDTSSKQTVVNSGGPQTSKIKADAIGSTLRFKPKDDSKSQQSTTKAPKTEKTADAIEYDDEEYYDDLDETVKSSTATAITSEHPMPIIRKFKRPFFTEQRGNPFNARSLQPIGSKASSKNAEGITYTISTTLRVDSSTDKEVEKIEPDLTQVIDRVKSQDLTTSIPVEVASSKDTNEEVDTEIKPTPIRIKVPIRVVPPITQNDPASQKNYVVDSLTTEKTTLTEADILNGNYDVSINEAISPLIPKLPVRNYGGFNTGDYPYKRIQRPTKYVILNPVVSNGAYYVK